MEDIEELRRKAAAYDFIILQKKARYATRRVKRQPCKECGKTPEQVRIYAHHPDYSKPLEIEWLCRPCHHLAHVKLGWGTPGKKGSQGKKGTKKAERFIPAMPPVPVVKARYRRMESTTRRKLKPWAPPDYSVSYPTPVGHYQIRVLGEVYDKSHPLVSNVKERYP